MRDYTMKTDGNGVTTPAEDGLSIDEQRQLLALIERANKEQRVLLAASMVILGYFTMDEMEKVVGDVAMYVTLRSIFGEQMTREMFQR